MSGGGAPGRDDGSRGEPGRHHRAQVEDKRSEDKRATLRATDVRKQFHKCHKMS